jgi:hypothetical protein
MRTASLAAITLLAVSEMHSTRYLMRSDFHILREKHVRDELALQRRLGAARRAASTLMPSLRRTGLTVKPTTGAQMSRLAGRFQHHPSRP